MLRANNKAEALNAKIERNVLRRIGKADEIAAVVACLATHEAGFLTSETVHVTGGEGCDASSKTFAMLCPATGFATISAFVKGYQMSAVHLAAQRAPRAAATSGSRRPDGVDYGIKWWRGVAKR